MLNITEIIEDKTATARGRREGREIKLSDRENAANASKERAEVYRAVASDLQSALEFRSYGMNNEEVEHAELVIELLENLAIDAFKRAVTGR